MRFSNYCSLENKMPTQPLLPEGWQSLKDTFLKQSPIRGILVAVSQRCSNYWIFRTPGQSQALSSIPWTWREDSTGKRCPVLRQGEEPLLEHGVPSTCTGGPFSSLRINAIIRGKRVQIFSRPHGKWICMCSIKGVTVTSNMQESTQVTVDVSALLPPPFSRFPTDPLNFSLW